MSYLALYRKYRSKTFDEVYGQDSIVRTLKNALKSNKIAHAYLFSGPRGTGKTSIARLFAKALNCEKGLGNECNSCSNCEEIIAGTSPDVIEIDAASNSGVDEVRNLIERIKYAPIKSRYKVYIIDEVHMMSNSAFNALLKTLEEPPSYVVFILCTTELYKVLPTIVSRCQRYEFKKINDDSLKKLLVHVLNKEQVTYSTGVLDLICELANGGARDALSILDQVISFSGSSIVVEDIESLFGLATKKDKISLLENVKNKDSLGLIKKYQDLVDRNVDLIRFVNELLLLLKDTLIFKDTNESSSMYTKIVSDYFDKNKLMSLIDTLLELQKEYKFTNNPNLITELYLLKLIKDDDSNAKVIYKEVSTKTKEAIKPTNNEKMLENSSLVKPQKEEVPIVIKEPTPKVVFEAREDFPKQNTEGSGHLSSLFKDENETFTAKEISQPLSPTGNYYFLEEDDLIKVTVLNNAKAKRELLSRWKLLTKFIDDPKTRVFAGVLLETTPLLLTSTLLVLTVSKKEKANIINSIEYQNSFSSLVSKIAGAVLDIYAIDQEGNRNLINLYRSLYELNKLPKEKDLTKVTLKKGGY